MTPDLAQATVTAFAAQRTATTVALAASGERAASATAAAAEFRQRAVEAAATATARAQPSSTSTPTAAALPTATRTPPPLPIPTTGPRFTMSAGGSGEIQLSGGTASFGFGVGKRVDGKLDGWLIYGGMKGMLRASEFASIEVQGSSAGFWGFGYLSDRAERVSVNVVVSSGGQGGGASTFRLIAYGPGGAVLLQEGGPVIRGTVSLDRS